MARLRAFPSALRRSPGFSLVEILVAMAIGLIGMLMMARMTESWEARKRSSAYSGDAQVSGSIALYRLTQDIRLAGYGFGTSDKVGCIVRAYDSARSAPNFIFPMAPVVITDGGGGAPDNITVLYGDSPSISADISFTEATDFTLKTEAGASRIGIRKGDLVIATSSTNATECELFEITDNTNTDALTLNHNIGDYVDFMGFPATARYNPATPAVDLTSGGGGILNMGLVPRRNTWQIDSGLLQSRNELRYVDFDGDGSHDWAQIADGIIDLQAEYGLDTDGDTIIDTWNALVPGTWSQVRAVRVALLARSQQYEKTAVTTTAPAWTGGDFVMTNVDGTADTTPNDTNDWRRYRYRVYETVIPLRNMLWGTAP